MEGGGVGGFCLLMGRSIQIVSVFFFYSQYSVKKNNVRLLFLGTFLH